MGTSKNFESYIDSVLAQVRFSEAHGEIRHELLAHLEEAKELGLGLGHSEMEVEDQVIRRMGDAHEVGRKLNDTHRPKIDLLLIGLVSVLLAVGVGALFQTQWFGLHLLWSILGLVVATALGVMKPTTLCRSSWFIYGLSIVLGGSAVLWGQWYEGQPYLSLGFLRIKMVDLSVVLFAVSLAGPLSEIRQRPLMQKVAPVVAGLVPLFAYISIGSFYPAIVLLSAFVVMMVVSRQPAGVTVAFAGIGAALLALCAKSGAFLSASETAQALISEKHTDYVFEFVGHSSPLISYIAAGVAASLIVHLASMLGMIRSQYGRTLLAGTATLMSIGVAWGLFSNLGWIPMPSSGVYFPFLSYSGSLMVAHMGMVGLILGIYRRKNLHFV